MRCEVYLDTETRSPVDLKSAGAHRYFQDPFTDITHVQYAIDDGPVFVWKRGQPIPYDLVVAITDGAIVYIHNAEFDVTGWNMILSRRHGWPRLSYGQVRCTAAMAAAMGLPRSLDGAAHAVKLPIQKDVEGGKLMRRLCKPVGVDELGCPLWNDNPDDHARMDIYARRDIEVLRPLRRRLLDLRTDEQALFELTTRINERGIKVDQQAVQRAIPMVQEANAELAKRIRGLTNEAVQTPMQRNKLLGFMSDYLVMLPNARRKTLELFNATAQHVPEVVDEVIQTRLLAAKTSVAKLTAMLSRASPADGRLRGALVYYGAATGRYSSTGVQLHNLPRPRAEMSFKDCCDAVEYVRAKRSDLIDCFYGPILQVISDCLRTFFVPERGSVFVVADFAKIEAVVNAWCAGQHDMLSALTDKNRDAYAEMASSVYGFTVIRKVHKVEGQVGKALVLGAGYGMGGSRFWEMCILTGIPVTLDFAVGAIQRYRQVNDRIVMHWYDQERAAMDAVRAPGTPVTCGTVEWLFRSQILWCRLPSGRALAYPYACIRDRLDANKVPRPRLHYMGIDPFTHKWTLLYTYGASLTENIVQAIARDLLVRVMHILDSMGVPIVLTVHDELVAEVPAKSANGVLSTVLDVMADPPAWGRGIPLSAAGGILPRYGKLE
jgi:DNA polymerase family A